MTSPLTLFRTAVPFWGHPTRVLSNLSPKRDYGPKRANLQVEKQISVLKRYWDIGTSIVFFRECTSKQL